MFIKTILAFLLALYLVCCRAQAEEPSNEIRVSSLKGDEILFEAGSNVRICRIAGLERPIKISSDQEAIIVGGDTYVPVGELANCKSDHAILPRVVAPQVGFLSDVSLKMNIYTAMVPVAVGPLSFVPMVGRMGSRKLLITLPGFYRRGVSMKKLGEESSTSPNPTLSIDGRYVSVGSDDCSSPYGFKVVNIAKRRREEMSVEQCQKLFVYRKTEYSEY